MSRESPMEVLLLNFLGVADEGTMLYRMTREEAYEELKRRSGEDFGWDGDKWEEWVRNYEASWVQTDEGRDRVERAKAQLRRIRERRGRQNVNQGDASE